MKLTPLLNFIGAGKNYFRILDIAYSKYNLCNISSSTIVLPCLLQRCSCLKLRSVLCYIFLKYFDCRKIFSWCSINFHVSNICPGCKTKVMFRRIINAEKNIHLPCCITGHPPVQVSWFKDEQRLSIAKEGTTIENVKYQLHRNNLVISRTDVSGSGSYHCLAINSAGHEMGKSFLVKLHGECSFKVLLRLTTTSLNFISN